MMEKFKVGDRVRILPTSPGCFFAPGDTGIIYHDDGSNYRPLYVKFDNHSSFGWVCESEIEPLAAIPDGWTPADEPPDSWRNVRVTLNDGREWYGWWSVSFCKWRVYEDDANEKTITSKPEEYCSEIHEADDGEVIAWREIEPERKADPRVRYCVAADLPTSITVWHDTFEAADAEAQRLCVKCGKPFCVLKVVEEVKPGKPEVVKLEE